MTWQLLLDLVVSVFMLGGTFFMMITGIGLLRFPDVYSRMHAAGKAGTTGVALLILAAAAHFAPTEPFVTARGLLAIIFQGLTTPGATYLLAHACYATRQPTHNRTKIDELTDWLSPYADDKFGHD